MRSTGNFSPEWGYLAPAPSILRTMRVVLVATAVGATAGAGVVLSLVDHSTGDGEKVSMAARAIVTSAQAAPIAAAVPAVSEAKIAPANVTAAAPAAQMPAQNALQAAQQIQAAQQNQAAVPATAQPDNTAHSAAIAAPAQQAANPPADSTSDASAVSVPLQPAVAALSDAPVAAAMTSDATGSDQTMVVPQAVPAKKTKHRTANGQDNNPGLGSALRHLFSARAGTSYYPNRGL